MVDKIVIIYDLNKGLDTSVTSADSSELRDEEVQEDLTKLGFWQRISACMKLAWSDPKIWCVMWGMTFFEAQMMLMVLSWPKSFFMLAGQVNVRDAMAGVSCGQIFAILLSGYLVGSCCFNFTRKWQPAQNFVWKIAVFAGCGTLLSASFLTYCRTFPGRNEVPSDPSEEVLGDCYRALVLVLFLSVSIRVGHEPAYSELSDFGD